MQLDQVAPYVLFVAVAAGTPGPANVLVAATGASVGVLRGMPCLLGVAVGTGALLGTVAFGLGAFVLEHEGVLATMNWVGAALLLWLAWRIATASAAAPDPSGLPAPARPVGFAAAAALQWVNPKSWIVATSAAGTYLAPDAGSALAQASLFAGLFVLVAIPAVGVWLVFGAAMRRLLAGEGARRAFNRAMGGLLALSVLLIVV